MRRATREDAVEEAPGCVQWVPGMPRTYWLYPALGGVVRNPQATSSQPLTQGHCLGRRADTTPGPWKGENEDRSPPSKELEVGDNLSP